uniref:AlNc14C74G5033 protein n=1 Tax=Albugo laibachii Nc14 TaxID=890382 RepID=F0WEI0_9STRA|nr:AlNc14C74G5033 [Albugo laibachii Nc14]|eukprot:CCA19612.1 AlNc14C74G5033 [Albugo laibachii Nc14]
MNVKNGRSQRSSLQSRPIKEESLGSLSKYTETLKLLKRLCYGKHIIRTAVCEPIVIADCYVHVIYVTCDLRSIYVPTYITVVLPLRLKASSVGQFVSLASNPSIPLIVDQPLLVYSMRGRNLILGQFDTC